MEKDTTAGLAAEKLARLLAIGCDPELGGERDGRSATAGQVLEAYLASTSMVTAGVSDPSWTPPGPDAGGRVRSVGEILNDPRATADAIGAIRRSAKHLTAQRVSEAERAAATALYFAAIAHGLVFRNEKLTTLSYDALQTSLGELLEKPWLSPSLVLLFQKARTICRTRAT